MVSEETKQKQAECVSQHPEFVTAMLKDALCLLGRVAQAPDDEWMAHRKQLISAVENMLDVKDFECEWCGKPKREHRPLSATIT